MFDGAEVSGDASLFSAFGRVLDECRMRRGTTLALLGSPTEADLDRTSDGAPAGAEGLFGTSRRRVHYVADRWYMHRGRPADARRTAGIERMWF